MRALVQRVSHSKVSINGSVAGEIGRGLLIFLGCHRTDTEQDAKFLAKKIYYLRIFPAEDGKSSFHQTVEEISKEVLVVSQFTLYGYVWNGRRPEFFEAAEPVLASTLYENFNSELYRLGAKVKTGVFGAMMEVELCNSGPASFYIDTADKS